jgi:hypothetical protein
VPADQAVAQVAGLIMGITTVILVVQQHNLLLQPADMVMLVVMAPIIITVTFLVTVAVQDKPDGVLGIKVILVQM